MTILIYWILLIGTLFTQLSLSTPPEVNNIIAQLTFLEKPTISEKILANKPIIISIYSKNNYQYMWPNDYINDAIELLQHAQEDGLLKKDYHYFKLLELTHLYNRKNANSQKIRANIDILLTDGILNYQSHLTHGKIPPESVYQYWNYPEVDETATSIITKLKKSIKNRTLTEDTLSLRPQFKWYKNLQHELMYYEQLAMSYTGETIPYRRIIRQGEHDKSVPNIAKKLYQLDLLHDIDDRAPTLYSKEISQSVKIFQQLHTLKSDGVLGPETIKLMNIPYQERADQIKANLERARWVSDDLTDNYLLINIASYKLTYVHESHKEWTSEVIVGKDAHKTPVFTAKLRYIEFNPTWTVPKSMLPPIVTRAKNNPDYLKQRRYLVKTSKGSTVNPDSINWKNVDPYHFNYWLVQEPSDFNSLGHVKFMFPNPHAIYLHDTPSKQLFALDDRSFSMGCIRLNHPFDLSLLLLENDQGFTEERQNQIRTSRKRTSVTLKHPIDVFVMYWTALPEKDGLHFYKDVYDRDKKLISLLNTPSDELFNEEEKNYHTNLENI